MAELVKIPITGISTSQRKIDKHPYEIVRVLRALIGATLFIQSEREVGIGLLEKTLSLTAAPLKVLCSVSRAV
jgi:ABC-type nitrate/sulfonate/bicarbonate transport system substrate-binding protein